MLFALIAVLLAYLIGAFYEVTFNIALWKDNTRMNTAIAMAIAVCCVVLFYFPALDMSTPKCARIALTEVDFEKLVNGKEIEIENTHIILKDIGFYIMEKIITEAKNN
jgi:hypothetical protein